MLALVNVPIGAILGVVLATSPIFIVNKFEDLLPATLFVGIIIVQAANIYGAISAIVPRQFGPLAIWIGLYLIVEIALFLSYTLDPSLLPVGQQGVAFRFTGFGHLWLFILTTLMWLICNVLAATWDEFGPTR